jgi:hypothetical protein
MNANAYGNTLRWLRKAIHRKRMDDSTRCDPSARQCSPTQRTSETSVAAVASPRNCGPSTPILTLRFWTIISWGCLTTDARIDFSVMRKCKWLFADSCKCKRPISSRVGFFLTRRKMWQMHHCARVLCIKMMILYWNKWATFNVVMIPHSIAMTYRTLFGGGYLEKCHDHLGLH